MRSTSGITCEACNDLHKLFACRRRGKISLSDRVNVSANAWAAKLPGSSLMFLEPGQRVTVEELLRGLAIVSGTMPQ